ncbi:hypothetical protein KY495_08795 [Massilia sp. PAMC28688]|uniref:hypothetical protein n=1 Tax=Massilia sp. PAMC28688 TaxID=2861283 RepID=UPI001C62FE90|nr:hypothetical protein [Massilia sp. PAMC28688]QYF95232.1 hypothetical protein KY495_08795 [Massilia sp. PAMC28688]
MKTFKQLCILPLLAGLAGCVGIITTPTVPVPEVDHAQFVALVQQAPCAAGDNRLFVIDQRYVYWDRGASCPDQVQRLYGRSTGALLCVHGNSPNGAYTNCSVPSVRGLFQVILNNRDRADLGLGVSHSVVEIKMPVQESANLVFRTVVQESFSGIREPLNVIVRDAEAWARLWARHTAGRTPAPALPKVDFSRSMLVAVFAGDLRGCHEFGIRRINLVDQRIVVEYEDRDITPSTICIAAITNPMQVVAVPRVEARAVFRQVAPQRLEFTTIDRTPYSRIEEPMSVVIRDAQSWAALWARHTGSSAPAPVIDFTRNEVVGVFRGVLPNGCYATEIKDVYRIAGDINVERVDTEPGEGSVCTLAIVTPAHIISVPRAGGSVTFSAQRRVLP